MIEIGKKINALRREKCLTQEQLADVFSVSVTAVSKWESASSHPDITLLPKIAAFFDISVDCLLGYDMHQVTVGINERIDAASHLFYDQGKREEGLALISELALKYPTHVRLLTKYAQMKFARFINAKENDEKRMKAIKESEAILRKININTLTRQEYDEVLLVQNMLYMAQKNFDKCEEIFEKLRPSLHTSFVDSHELNYLCKAGNTDKAEAKFHYILWKGLEGLLHWGAWNIYYQSRNNPETAILYYELALKILLAVTKDEPSYLDDSFSRSHEAMAHMYACLNDKDKTLYHMEKSIGYALRNRSCRDKLNRLPVYFSKLDNEIADKILTVPDKPLLKWVIHSNERKEYDFVRDTVKFQELLKTIEEHGL